MLNIVVMGQPEDEDDDGDDDEDEEGEWRDRGISSPPISLNLPYDDDGVNSFSFSFLLPVHTDRWAGLNCHVTFFVVVDGSAADDSFTCVVVGCVAMASSGVAAIQVVTLVTVLALLSLFRSCCVKSSVGTSASVTSPYMSQSGSAGSRCGWDTAADLIPESLEQRLGSESDRSESQSLSQPSTDTSTGPEPELSESESLE